jgi:hypothetical protein
VVDQTNHKSNFKPENILFRSWSKYCWKHWIMGESTLNWLKTMTFRANFISRKGRLRLLLLQSRVESDHGLCFGSRIGANNDWITNIFGYNGAKRVLRRYLFVKVVYGLCVSIHKVRLTPVERNEEVNLVRLYSEQNSKVI